LLGFTPDHFKKGIRVVGIRLWFVRPMGMFRESEWKVLARDINRQNVPGLDLANRWDVEDQTLASLGNLQALRLLQLDRTRVTDSGLAKLAALPQLEILSVSPKTSDLGLRAISALTRLRDLDLRGSKVSEAGLNHLTAFPRLTTLALNQNMSDTAADILLMLSHLVELDLSLTSMGDDGIARLEPLALESLYAGPQLTDAGLAHIGTWQHLRRLDLSRTQITDAGLASLEMLPHLEELALTDTSITDAGLAALSHLTSLRTLELSGTHVTSAGFEFLVRLTRLETLSLSVSQLSSDETKLLARLTHLKTLILDGSPVPQAMLASLAHTSGAHPLKAPRAAPLPAYSASPEANGIDVIQPHLGSRPAGASAKLFSTTYHGVSGLRKIQRIQTETSELSDIIPASQRKVEDTEPKNFLGDIDVRVKR
jgi:hypothetical protein